jgi:beta-fructofuranosidase
VTTDDCANYESLGEILPTGSSVMDADAALGTGCAVYSEADKQYYIYYTGHSFQAGSQR